MLSILYDKTVKSLPIAMDLSDTAFELAAKELELKDDNFILYVNKSLYIEALKCVSMYLTLIDSDKKSKNLIKILKHSGVDDWALEKDKIIVFSPGA